MNLDAYLILYTKIDSKWIRDLNIKAKTIKFLQENIGVNLHNRFVNGFLYSTSIKVTKENVDKLDCIKMKYVCASKDTIKKEKENPQIG